jgi:hypothetical protein
MTLSVIFDVEASTYSGTNKANRPFNIYSAYVAAAGFRHPQSAKFYSETVYSPGTRLDVPMVPTIKDGDFTYTPDFKAAKPVPVRATA